MGVTYIKDSSEKFNEFYILAFENDFGTSYCVTVTIDTVVVNNNPNEAMRFNSEDEAKIFFFNHFERIQDCYWQETDCWSDAHLINAFVIKITTELSSCKPCL